MVGDNIKFLSYGEGTIRRGMLYPSRKSGMNELIYLSEGNLCICEGYREYRLSGGDILLLDGSSGHYGFRESDVDSVFSRVIFSGDFTQPALALSQHRCFRTPHPERFTQLLGLMKLYCGLPEYPDDSTDYILRLMLTELFVDGLPRDEDITDRYELCGRVCDYVKERNGIIKPAEVAEHFGYKSKYLSAVFCSRYARGLKSYIDAVRLAYLKFLLSSDMTVSEAALQAGFEAAKPMQDFFRYNTGVTVSDWIAEHLKQE